ncbi:hypothetical protein H6G82_22175 [Planktothricoides sp. FACHB-1261]|nr:hypothetical protein [Planktothricoides raciborskii FACHB-1261]
MIFCFSVYHYCAIAHLRKEERGKRKEKADENSLFYLLSSLPYTLHPKPYTLHPKQRLGMIRYDDDCARIKSPIAFTRFAQYIALES